MILPPSSPKPQSFSHEREEDLAFQAVADQPLLQQNLWAILNSITEGILVVDQDLIVTQVNQAALAITGFPSNEILGRPCMEIFRAELVKKCPLPISYFVP